LYSSVYVVVVVVMDDRWAGHAEMKNTQRTALLFCKPEGKKDIYGSVRIILNWILRKWDGRGWTGYIWLKTGTNGRL
jgi:hypothetical protein